ncbi:MAG: hypothetical protein ABI480_08595, partial [Chitinophagaceae bacterium]
MKKYLFVFIAGLLFADISSAQLGNILKRKAGEGAKKGAQTGTEKAIDKGVNNIFSKKNKKSANADSTNQSVSKTSSGGATTSSTTTNTNTPPPELDEPIPAIINFDWQVVQRTAKDPDDDDNNGKAYQEVTYYFTSNGDYTAIKPEDKSFSLMIYSKKGHTWIFDDKDKTITVMSMPKIVGEGAQAGKDVATSIKKAPLAKDKGDEKFTITKTGKTKTILTYTAEEYELKNTSASTTSGTSKTGTGSFWYITAPFDPVKIYTMGAGRPADISKMQNDPKFKNNI